ncbi:hypothetical protein RhiirA5_414204 [Rhizophagus irregularis]|uniref:Uncharacterized protein n=1 Tax=Rhizophagus irregularis TaxID=588596 RepID=A0A2N0PUM9_9GLOM|nr:hypothetical protein RhiirA5_414204 [Rhizophagus irregularis]
MNAGKRDQIEIFFKKKFISKINYSSLRLLAETKGFRQNGIRETAETSFVKSSRNAETAKPIKIAKLP